MELDYKTKNLQNRIFATYNIPEELEDFVEEYQRDLNYASIISLKDEIPHMNFVKMERNFYLKEANELAKICQTQYSPSKYIKIKEITDALEKECPVFKERLEKYIDKDIEKINIDEFDEKLNDLASDLTHFCEMKFKLGEKTLSKFDKKIEEAKYKIKNFENVVFFVNIKELFKNNNNIKIFLNKMNEFKKENQSVKILLNAGFKDAQLFENGTPYVFSSDMLNNIRYLKNKLEKIGYDQISFSEYYSDKYEEYAKEWSYNSVIKSNKYVSNIINKIKTANHSPLEAMIFIHSVATLIPFSSKNKDMINNYSPESYRSVVGMIENGEAVCSAYAHLVKAVVDGLDMHGLSAQLNCCYIKEGFVGSKLYRFLQGGNHAQNLITIDDEKYGISGVYRNDCSWDAMRLDEEGGVLKGQTFTFFMNSLRDIQNLKNMVYKPFNIIKMKDFDTSYIKNFKGYKVAKLQTKLAEKEFKLSNSKQISFDKFVDAFENTYKKLGLDMNFISNTVFKITQRSCDYAEKLFNSDSQNIFKTLGKEIDQNEHEDSKKL